ncbi:MAG: threonine-phosphate decarboxylase CobD [Paenibacillaceae bacterium]
MKWPSHGGQPKYIKKLFALSELHQILDFSANLNPLGPPAWVRDAWSEGFDQTAVYPDPSYLDARMAIAEHEGLRPEQVVLTNGGAEAIFLAAKRIQGGRALIVHPTFGEYEQACAHYGIQIERVYLREEDRFSFPCDQVMEAISSVNAIFLCRPNNPTGTAVEEEALKNVLDCAVRNEVLVVIDEAFADFMPVPKKGLTDWVRRFPNLLLLRSMTKMFTIPGIRLGYALTQEETASAMRADQIPWSVNGAAAALVPGLMRDTAFVNMTREWLVEQWAALRSRLIALRFDVSSSCVNFYLLRDLERLEQTQELYLFLLNKGLLARHTTTFPGLDGRYLRLAVRSAEENEQLLNVLSRWRSES